MRASEKAYEKVAEKCSAFEPKKKKDTVSNSTCETCHCNVSCTNCKHFADDEHCVLDLYDQIVSNHDIDERM